MSKRSTWREHGDRNDRSLEREEPTKICPVTGDACCCKCEQEEDDDDSSS